MSSEDCRRPVSGNNELTVAVLGCLKSRSVNVPEGVGIAGIDDFPAADLLDPPLTVLRQPVARYAQHAVKLMQRLIANPRSSPDGVRCRGELIVRESL